MSHIYQPLMLKQLLVNGGRCSTEDIARGLLNKDKSQLEYYIHITNNMVGKVLRNRGLVVRKGSDYELVDHSNLSQQEIDSLLAACEHRLSEFIESRGDAIWDHRRKSSGYVSGTLRYEVLKSAMFRCDLCGVSADDRALEVDHILPRSKGGSDEISNLQALCYSCNAMKRDRDSTDFRLIRASYGNKSEGCPFCSLEGRTILFENSLAFAIEDNYPVTEGHILVVPKRHTPNYFDLGNPEVRACHELLQKSEASIKQRDSTVSGINVGINCGSTAGQTVMHCHIHLIPRRSGDHPYPRGGVRGVIPGKADYLDDKR